jgi:hypothetical protein
MKNRLIGTSLIALSGVVLLTGCVYRSERVTTPANPPTTVVTTAPSASPPTTVIVTPSPGQRVVTYPEGRYELYGSGTGASPYYWVWIPTGVTAPTPPPLPRVPQSQ